MSQSDRPESLSGEEARQLAEHLAVFTKSGLPLAPALRAAGEEIPNRRLSSAMTTLAAELAAGRSLEHVLAIHPNLLPPHMQRLIETGVRSGNLADVLVRLVDIDRTSADLRRSIRAAVAYPVLLVVLWLTIVAFIALYVMPGLGKVYTDLKTVLPLPTKVLMVLSGDWPMRILAFLVAAVPMIIVGMRVSLRPLGWQRALIGIPLVGRTLMWRGVANWSRLLSLLLRQQIPLPEASKLAADGAYAPIMSVHGLRLTKMIAGGRKLSDALATIRSLPASLVPLVRWGEERGALPEALESAADLFEARVQMRASLLQSILPPIVFILIGLGALGLLNAIVMPLLILMQNLMSMSWRRGVVSWGLSDETATTLLWVLGGAVTVWLVMSLVIWMRHTALGILLGGLTSYSDRQMLVWKSWVLALFRVFYVLLTALIALAVMVGIAGVCGFFLWLAAIVVALMILVRTGDMERRSLLWTLATAVEKGIPLPAAARAFASERRDKLGRRAERMAELLEDGAPLDAALVQAVRRVPADVLLAVRTGADARALAARLKNANGAAAQLDGAVHSAIARMVYLIMFVCFAAGLIAYLAMRIVPAFQHIFQDFHTRLPPLTTTMIDWFSVIEEYQIVGIVGLAFLVIVLLFTLARYIGLVRWDPPLLRRFSRALDGAVVLRSLADSVQGQRPLGTAMGTLARRYPKLHVRRQLQLASQRISDGADWCDSLNSSGLVPSPEAGVLKAAERVGNLAWALEDMADRLARRFTAQLTGMLSVGFPVVMLVFAAVVFLVVAGLFFPLATLITRLS